MKRLAVLAAAAALAAVTTTDRASAEDPIIIGAPVALSGWMVAYDTPPLNAAKMAVDDINAQGGLLGRQVELVIVDTKTEPAQTSKAAIEAMEAGAKFLMVSCDYDASSPAAFAAQSRGIIAISPCANDSKMGVQGIGSHAFTWSIAAQTQGYLEAEWGYKERGWRTAYSLLDNSIEYDKALCAGFNYRWKELAGEANFLGQDTFKNDDPSIASQITRIKSLASPPDVIRLCSYVPGGAAAIRQLRAAGIDTPILGSHSMDGSYWLETVPGLSNFYYETYASIYGDEPIAARQALLDRYVGEYGEPANSFFLTGYSLIMGYKLAVERAGTDDPDAVLAAYNKFQDEDIVGFPYTFSEDMHMQLQWPMMMIEVQNGKPSAIGYYKNEGLPPMDLLFPQ